ncbi:hypothetical protein Tco_1209373 [Tanacetum coccineum]
MSLNNDLRGVIKRFSELYSCGTEACCLDYLGRFKVFVGVGLYEEDVRSFCSEGRGNLFVLISFVTKIWDESSQVIQNGNSKKRISTRKDGVVRILPPVSAVEIHAVEKERKAITILLMVDTRRHIEKIHGMDDAKEIWEAIRTRFGGNANSKKMQKVVLKQQFEAFSISSSEGVFEQELTVPTKYLLVLKTLAFVSTQQQQLTPTTTTISNIKLPILKKEEYDIWAMELGVPAGFADEVIYSLFAKQSEDLDLLHEDLEQIDDVDIEEMDIN